ncbi:MAG: type IX secretion system sortase PorU, partial [Crocinitomicaceae bacterium]|nr:type IX secretion system sortase PorU [Crocinitomicaceae bacterium]
MQKTILIVTMILLVILLPNLSLSQIREFSFTTTWDDKAVNCSSCAYDELKDRIYTAFTKDLNLRGEFEHLGEIIDVQYEGFTLPSYYDVNALPTSPDFKIDFGKSRSQNFVSIYYYPIVNIDGVAKIVKNVKLKTESTAVNQTFDRAATFASSSVLSSGSWFKIGIPKSGVYKMDQTYLNSIGVNTTGLNPNSINVYGNHMPKLPIANNDYHPDDLIKNSIYIHGDVDNSFDNGDYILFYATGPDIENVSGDDFLIRKNNIDTLNYMFIHIDASDTPKRIGSMPNSTSTVTHVLSTFDDAVLHEKNEVNLLKSGSVWLGENFDVLPTTTISLTLKDVNTNSNIDLKTVYASFMKSGTGALDVSVNGVLKDNVVSSTTGGSYSEATLFTSSSNFGVSSESLSFSLTWNASSPSSKAWLDYLLINYERNATIASEQILMRDLGSVGLGNVVQYTIAGSNSTSSFWEVTDPVNVKLLQGSLTGSTYTFIQSADSLRSFVAFNSNQTYSPIFLSSVVNQNLHATPQLDYVIVTHSSLTTQAERLANLHRQKGLDVLVVDIQDVYNEFSGGVSDPVAIRWLMKMFYDRALGDPSLMPKYLCLFGDGSYDPLNRLENNNYLVATYNDADTDNSIDYLDSFTSDDFFGILDDSESMAASDMVDVAIGRIPVSTIEDAEGVVNKIEHYMNYGSSFYTNTTGVQCDENGYSSSFGDWRNRLVLMADDEDSGQFVRDCEKMSDSTQKLFPEMNIVKIYLDAYQQIITSGGQRYPDVEEAINQNMNKGALVFNYVGHGGETGLTLERALTYSMIENWNNVNNMTVFISATCEFSRFDDPERVSAGERTLTYPVGGAVALLTTTRLVLVTVNSK